MSKIEQAKAYTGSDLETIFFRPMLTGPNAEDLGVKIMYNMPVPTTLQFWKRAGDILQKFTSGGWKGGEPATKFQKTIKLNRVKAEVGYRAEDYFNMVYELITNRADVNMGDLSGTELEEAETTLFKEAIAESIRATMWIGDVDRVHDGAEFNTFDGFLIKILSKQQADLIPTAMYDTPSKPEDGEDILKLAWEEAYPVLRDMKIQGNLVYLVTSDVYACYEESLDNVLLESAYIAKQEGRQGLSYRGIPVIDVQMSGYLSKFEDMPQSFCLLTDRRNLALAVNTDAFPGTEVSMWYNPDLMENRQRAVFMAGCDYLMPELMSFAYSL